MPHSAIAAFPLPHTLLLQLATYQSKHAILTDFATVFVQSACGPACMLRGTSGIGIAVDAIADGFRFLLRVPPQHNAFGSLSEKAKKLAKACSP